MAEISIIIPVYNASKYLAECLDSVLVQTFTDIEIICINDGSTDDSLQILKAYQQKDSRIIIIDQKNGGVSAARNAGLAIAQGKYIGFVDSDDTVNPDYFDTLFKAAERHHADMVFSRSLSDSCAIKYNRLYNQQEIREFILPLYFKEDGHNSVWNKLYSAEVIRENNIIFPVGKTHGEDAVFNIHFLLHTSTLYTLDYSGYHYRETEGSATRNASGFDYLELAVKHFNKDWTSVLGDTITPDRMHNLKKERFINNIISQIYIYSHPENGLSLKSRLGKLHQITQDQLVQHLFQEENREISAEFSKYKKEVYRGIKSKSLIKLYLLSLYSYHRSR